MVRKSLRSLQVNLIYKISHSINSLALALREINEQQTLIESKFVIKYAVYRIYNKRLDLTGAEVDDEVK